MNLVTGCNLCGTYVHGQVQQELLFGMNRKYDYDYNYNYDSRGDNDDDDYDVHQGKIGNFDDIERQVQVRLFQALLFDESSIRLEYDDDDGDDDDDGNGNDSNNHSTNESRNCNCGSNAATAE